MTVKPCLDCQRPTSYGSRCQEHQREYLARREQLRDDRRGTRTERGLAGWERITKAAIAEQPWCSACGTTYDLQADHIIPVSKGGPSTIENCRVLCGDCNRKKGAKVLV